MHSPVSLLSSIYPVPAMQSLLVTSDVRNISFMSECKILIMQFCENIKLIKDTNLDILIGPIKGCS